jgi:hypothetical protein
MAGSTPMHLAQQVHPSLQFCRQALTLKSQQQRSYFRPVPCIMMRPAERTCTSSPADRGHSRHVTARSAQDRVFGASIHT